MKMKWLWTAWAYLSAVCLIALNLVAVTYSVVFLIPKMQKMKVDGMFWESDFTSGTLARAFSFLECLQRFWESWTQWVLVGLLVLWGLFEWRVRSESKPFIRLAVLGTLAIGLSVVVVLTAMSLILPFFMALAPPPRVALSEAIRRITSVDTAIAQLDKATTALEKSMTPDFWEGALINVDQASYALKRLETVSLPPLEMTPEEDRPEVAQFYARLKLAQICLVEVQLAVQHKDAERFQKAMRQFHDAYNQIEKAPKGPQEK